MLFVCVNYGSQLRGARRESDSPSQGQTGTWLLLLSPPECTPAPDVTSYVCWHCNHILLNILSMALGGKCCQYFTVSSQLTTVTHCPSLRPALYKTLIF